MLLGLLLGNTTLRHGAHDGRSIVSSGRVAWVELEGRAAELRDLLRQQPFEEILVGSVRDDLYPRVADLLPAAPRPVRFARRDFAIPIENHYEPPEDVGTDRLLNALAARSRAAGRGAVVVDFGTALSLSVVSPRGAFAGGLIAPGARALLLGLERATPRLPAVTLDTPAGFLHRRTGAAVQAGVVWQLVGGVREMVRGLVGEIERMARGAEGAVGPPLVLATGGDAARLAPHLPEIHEVVPDLTLEGLFLARGVRG